MQNTRVTVDRWYITCRDSVSERSCVVECVGCVCLVAIPDTYMMAKSGIFIFSIARNCRFLLESELVWAPGGGRGGG